MVNYDDILKQIIELNVRMVTQLIPMLLESVNFILYLVETISLWRLQIKDILYYKYIEINDN